MWRAEVDLRRERPRSRVRDDIGEVGDCNGGDLAGMKVWHFEETGWR